MIAIVMKVCDAIICLHFSLFVCHLMTNNCGFYIPNNDYLHAARTENNQNIFCY